VYAGENVGGAWDTCGDQPRRHGDSAPAKRWALRECYPEDDKGRDPGHRGGGDGGGGAELLHDAGGAALLHGGQGGEHRGGEVRGPGGVEL